MSGGGENPARGRARGRSRGNLPGQVPEGMQLDPGAQPLVGLRHEEPMDIGEGDHRALYGSSSGSPGSGNGNGHSPNGNNRRGSGHSPNGNGNGNGSPVNILSRGFRTQQPDFLTSRPEGFGKKGFSGASKRMITNYFELQMKKTLSLRMHLVTFSPELDDVKVRKGLLRQREPDVGPYLFDGAQLFTTRQLPDDLLNLAINFPDRPAEVYNVTIRFLRICSTTEPIAFMLYNLIIRKCQELLGLDLMGRFFYDHREAIKIHNHKLEMWPGVITSMRQMENDVLLNVDITFKVLRMNDVFSLMKEIRAQNPNNYRDVCNEMIVGSIVMTNYNRKTYRVDEIDWSRNPQHTFPKRVNNVEVQVSFKDYYEQRHKVQIQSMGQPMLMSKPKDRDIRRGDTGNVALIPELCYQTGLTEAMRADFRLMKDLSHHLHMLPQKRLEQTKRFMQRIRDSQDVTTELAKWGVRFKPEPVEVIARTMPTEPVVFQSGTFPPNESADWSQAFRNQKMLTTVPLKDWAVFVTQRDSSSVDNLVQTMIRVATPLGYRMGHPQVIRLNDGQTRTFQKAINDVMTDRKGRLDLAFIILPNPKLETYSAIKKMCAIDYGIPSQCCLSKTANAKGLMSICTKLVIQMNAKQGGEPWSVSNPLKGIMVVGFDVHHAGGSSFGAMTATMSASLATYFSTILRNEPGVEVAAGFGLAFEKCLVAFAKTNGGVLPGRIMIYRDGVGEGQLIYVNDAEVGQCKAVIKNIYQRVNQQLPRFSFVVVTKRINTRLFEVRNNGECFNPSPGTVVDDRITCPEKYDFYLVPQNARQGTVSPVAFNVIVDESGLDPDKMQRFTFKLCHLYFNWSGTVTVPAPCQYAHKLAFLTGTALQQAANDRLSNLLHFL